MSAYTAIASQTLGSSASSVTFSSIPGTGFRDLVLVVSNLRGTGAPSLFYRVNGDSSSSYSYVYMYGTGSAAQSFAGTDTTLNVLALSDTVSTTIISNFMDYSQTNKHKSVLNRWDNSSSLSGAFANRWANTAAITSITLSVSSTMSAGATFSLYGVSA